MNKDALLEFVSRETLHKLEIYVALLLKWQTKINLISNTTVNDVWKRHILDAIQLLSFYDHETSTLLDIGTGAGIPGLLLAIAGNKKTILVESDTRKSAFLKEAARVTDSNVEIHNKRIESLKFQDIDVITSRACANIHQLLIYSSNFLSNNTVCLFPKGENYTKEVEEAQKNWHFSYDVFPSLSDSSGNIIKIYNITKR
jgi:16S rRNA (guanine527-N7)-methyltransferase